MGHCITNGRRFVIISKREVYLWIWIVDHSILIKIKKEQGKDLCLTLHNNLRGYRYCDGFITHSGILNINFEGGATIVF